MRHYYNFSLYWIQYLLRLYFSSVRFNSVFLAGFCCEFYHIIALPRIILYEVGAINFLLERIRKQINVDRFFDIEDIFIASYYKSYAKNREISS